LNGGKETRKDFLDDSGLSLFLGISKATQESGGRKERKEKGGRRRG
jgi:hypothetical protein